METTLINNANPLFSAVPAIAAEPVSRAELAQLSNISLYLKPSAGYTIIVQFKNTGTAIWDSQKTFLKPLTTGLKFKHISWPDFYLSARMQEKSVLPNETGTFKLALQAPKNFGAYSGDFSLVHNNIMVDGGEFSVNINSVENPENYKSETGSTAKIKLNTCSLKLNIAGVEDNLDNLTCADKLSLPKDGPDIRTGIFKTKQAITVANNKAWQVYDKNDILLASVPANIEIRFHYIESKGQYTFDFIDQTVRTSSSLKLKNFENGIFEITSHQDIAPWNKTINYNKFIGDMEISRYEKTGNIWLIENLALEKYLKGIKETSNEDPAEYQRAMTIAARTYALYHVNKFKTEESFFDVYSDEKDQVYKGYQAELVMPNQAGIVEETRGVVATYADQVIIAYYSARSGGQTIASGKLPYLKSVSTPYTKALGKWGHAIGIDAVDAKNRAGKEGWTYDQILKYYYQGINLEKIY